MDRKAFFDVCRKTVMGPTLDGDEVSGTETILDAMKGTPLSWCAYALATAKHETGGTMQPIKEMGGPSYFFRRYDPDGDKPHIAAELGNTYPGDGEMYAGRGFVQLTGRKNYTLASKRTGYPLVGNPDLAMRPDIAADIMRRGMEEGWFTGKGFIDYLPREGRATRTQFTAARRIINGTDKASIIAAYALFFQDALDAGSWE